MAYAHLRTRYPTAAPPPKPPKPVTASKPVAPRPAPRPVAPKWQPTPQAPETPAAAPIPPPPLMSPPPKVEPPTPAPMLGLQGAMGGGGGAEGDAIRTGYQLLRQDLGNRNRPPQSPVTALQSLKIY